VPVLAAFLKMNRLFAASLLVVLVAILSSTPALATGYTGYVGRNLKVGDMNAVDNVGNPA